MHNENVDCKNCNKRLAWWDSFTNIQYENEYQCFAIVTHHVDSRRKYPDNELIMNNAIPYNDKKGIEIKRLTREIWKVTYIKGKTIHKDNWSYCEIVNKTMYCEECAKKLRFKCPICGGTIVLVRKK